MYINVKALVIKEKKQGENGKLLTVLTPSHGQLTVSAKGGIGVSSRFFAACQLYAYSDMTLFKRGNYYTLIEAKTNEVFFGLNNSLTSLSLACWMCECAGAFCADEENRAQIFRLLLNSLWYLQKKPERHRFIKLVFELRTLFIAGYCPDLVCAGCGKEPTDSVYFDVSTGETFCPECGERKGDTRLMNADMTAVLVYLAGCDAKSVFSFTVSEDAEKSLSSIAESFFLSMTEIETSKLIFYRNTLE